MHKLQKCISTWPKAKLCLSPYTDTFVLTLLSLRLILYLLFQKPSLDGIFLLFRLSVYAVIHKYAESWGLVYDNLLMVKLAIGVLPLWPERLLVLLARGFISIAVRCRIGKAMFWPFVLLARDIGRKPCSILKQHELSVTKIMSRKELEPAQHGTNLFQDQTINKLSPLNGLSSLIQRALQKKKTSSQSKPQPQPQPRQASAINLISDLFQQAIQPPKEIQENPLLLANQIKGKERKLSFKQPFQIMTKQQEPLQRMFQDQKQPIRVKRERSPSTHQSIKTLFSVKKVSAVEQSSFHGREMLWLNNKYRMFRRVELSLCKSKQMVINDSEGNICQKVIVVNARAVKDPSLVQIYTLDGEERFFGLDSVFERDQVVSWAQ